MDGKTQTGVAEAHEPAELSADFRLAMRRHAASVCLVTIGQGQAMNGMTITAATSFSMEPPSVLICVNKAASLTPQLVLGAGFGLTILGRHQDWIASAFARSPGGRARFDHGAWRLDERLPWLEDAASNLHCTVVEAVAYGSHVAVIGRVDWVRLGEACPSLVYRDGTYDIGRQTTTG